VLYRVKEHSEEGARGNRGLWSPWSQRSAQIMRRRSRSAFVVAHGIDADK